MIGEMKEQIEKLIKAGLTRRQAEDAVLEAFTTGVRASLERREARGELEKR